jgi:hypothetical protein
MILKRPNSPSFHLNFGRIESVLLEKTTTNQTTFKDFACGGGRGEVLTRNPLPLHTR